MSLDILMLQECWILNKKVKKKVKWYFACIKIWQSGVEWRWKEMLIFVTCTTSKLFGLDSHVHESSHQLLMWESIQKRVNDKGQIQQNGV